MSVYLSAVIIGYCLGSIPFGLLLTRAAGTADLRSIGSGNIGATNVLRTGRKDLAALTLLLDAAKGAVAVILSRYMFGPQTAEWAGLAAFVAHLWPIWLRFQGGKGVATFLGVTLGLWWPAGLLFALVWLGVAAFSRYSSLSALVASALVPMALILAERAEASLVLAICVALIWWRHSQNIRRLLNGTETRIGQSP